MWWNRWNRPFRSARSHGINSAYLIRDCRRSFRLCRGFFCFWDTRPWTEEELLVIQCYERIYRIEDKISSVRGFACLDLLSLGQTCIIFNITVYHNSGGALSATLQDFLPRFRALCSLRSSRVTRPAGIQNTRLTLRGWMSPAYVFLILCDI